VLKLPRVYICVCMYVCMYVYVLRQTDPPENLARCSSFLQLTQAFIISDAMWRALRKCVREREKERDEKTLTLSFPQKTHHRVNTAEIEPEPWCEHCQLK
jgi:hypothetical protein